MFTAAHVTYFEELQRNASRTVAITRRAAEFGAEDAAAYWEGLFAGPTGAIHVCFPTDPDHTPAAVWEALVTRGLFPETWLANPQRFFLRPAGFRAYPKPKPKPKPSAETLLGLKGSSFLDAGYVWGPYIDSAPADEGRVPLPDVAARVGVARRTLQRWKAAGLYQLPGDLAWRVDRSAGEWTDREIVDAYLRGGSTVRGLATELDVSRGTAHTRLLGVTDTDERKRAGL